MMSGTYWRAGSLLAIAAVLPLAVMIAEGCGSDSFTAKPSTDGGDEDSATIDVATGPQDSGLPVADACVKPPNVAASEVDFCAAFAAISTRCLDCDPCRQVNANQCDKFGEALSDPLRNGIIACQDTIACSAFESQVGLATDPCVINWIFDAGPTPAQLAVRDDYCTACIKDGGADAMADCQEQYFGQPDGGVGVGSLAFIATDSVASSMATCGGAGTCNTLDYYSGCTAGKFCMALGKDTCPSSKALCK
jgi:hypothetical protein